VTNIVQLECCSCKQTDAVVISVMNESGRVFVNKLMDCKLSNAALVISLIESKYKRCI